MSYRNIKDVKSKHKQGQTSRN